MQRVKLMDGMHTRQTTSGFLAIELDYWADPNKTEQWRNEMEARMKNPARFRREYLRDWKTPGGAGFYPEYLYIPEERRSFKVPNLLAGPIVRGWDLGYRRPACVWLQYSEQSNRIVVLRELMPADIDTHSFRDLVRYLSGEIGPETLTPKALQWVERIRFDAERGQAYDPPWFACQGSRPLEFLDFAGPEAQRISPTVEWDKKERTDAQVLEAGGVNLQIYGVSVEFRTETLRRLMRVREDGWPGIVLDPSCRIIRDAFEGKLVFKEKTPGEPLPNAPRKDGYYEHLHDALGYAVVNLVPPAEEGPRKLQWGVQTAGPGWLKSRLAVPGGPIQKPQTEERDTGLTGWVYG